MLWRTRKRAVPWLRNSEKHRERMTLGRSGERGGVGEGVVVKLSPTFLVVFERKVRTPDLQGVHSHPPLETARVRGGAQGCGLHTQAGWGDMLRATAMAMMMMMMVVMIMSSY